MILAVTGGTGFVGGCLIETALNDGHRVRALTRRPQQVREGVTWIDGALDDPASLDRLVDGAAAVIHVAGVVNAPDRAGFASGNIDGTTAILRATGNRRYIHVSSLAAREPQLSDYGWSKAEAERRVEDSTSHWTIVRPPAIYGPGDLDQLDLFRMARFRVMVLPPSGRLSVVAVDDLARLLLALAIGDRHSSAIVEADDGTEGYTHVDYARMIGRAMGRPILPLPLPRALLSAVARLDRAIRGDRARLTPDRVAVFSHPDWTIDPERRPVPALWSPQIATGEGLARTAQWYRAQGLL